MTGSSTECTTGKYKLVVNHIPEELEKQVDALMKEGWYPDGHLVQFGGLLVQPMTSW